MKITDNKIGKSATTRATPEFKTGGEAGVDAVRGGGMFVPGGGAFVPGLVLVTGVEDAGGVALVAGAFEGGGGIAVAPGVAWNTTSSKANPS